MNKIKEKLLKEIEEVKEQLMEIKEEDMSEASWNYEQGVVITGNLAEYFLRLEETSKAKDEEFNKILDDEENLIIENKDYSGKEKNSIIYHLAKIKQRIKEE